MKLFDFFKRKTNISIQIKPLCICKKSIEVTPYYLDNTEQLSIEEITSELKEWTTTGTLDRDEIYDSMIKKLDTIKDSITWTKELYNNSNIELCSEGLELSIKLCNYCIGKKYDSVKFVKSKTKYYFNYFTDQLEYWKTFNEYKEAESLEKSGLFENAIKKYLDLLESHIPLGSIYYESPFYLCIKIADYASAFNVYNYLKTNFDKTNNKTLESILNDFTNIICSLETNENMYPEIKAKIITIIKDTPGILQSDLYKSFDSKYKESLRFIIQCFEKSQRIKREKSGRSYKLFLN
jgi:hypothetical protein